MRTELPAQVPTGQLQRSKDADAVDRLTDCWRNASRQGRAIKSERL